jgi:hypothetical protein
MDVFMGRLDDEIVHAFFEIEDDAIKTVEILYGQKPGAACYNMAKNERQAHRVSSRHW